MKLRYILFIGIFLTAYQGFGQKIWTVPAEFNANDEIKLFIDIKACDCQRLLGTSDSVFLWTWQPSADADRLDMYKNGQWTASNPNMAMTHEGNDVYSITMIPTEFYNVDAATIFANDISCLAKLKDGTGAGGGGCDEDKTEDLMLAIEPPAVGPQKVFSFPAAYSKDSLAITPDDVYTLVYDNKLEEKASMQNATELYVYAQAVTVGGQTIRVSTLRNVDDNPALRMKNNGDGTFEWTIIPNRLYNVPGGDQLDILRLQIIKPNLVNSADAVDGQFEFRFNCKD